MSTYVRQVAATDSPDAVAWRREFGDRVRYLRNQTGMSQMALANAAGLHPTYVSDVERGVRNISLVNIRAIARSLGARPGDLFD
jgi:transcriptional regulator with XRE-family HTH domain